MSVSWPYHNLQKPVWTLLFRGNTLKEIDSNFLSQNFFPLHKIQTIVSIWSAKLYLDTNTSLQSYVLNRCAKFIWDIDCTQPVTNYSRIIARLYCIGSESVESVTCFVVLRIIMDLCVLLLCIWYGLLKRFFPTLSFTPFCLNYSTYRPSFCSLPW